MNLLKELGYKYCGFWLQLNEDQEQSSNYLRFKYNIENKEISNMKGPLVYIWVQNKKIIYAGESSRCVKQRMSDHEGGFRGGSKSGIERQKNLLKLDKNRFDVYVAFEPFLSIHLQKMINNTNDIFFEPIEKDQSKAMKREEKLIISIFDPILNNK
jgi:hypothetical protein